MRRSAVPTAVILACAALVGLLVYGVVGQDADRTLDDKVADGERPAAPDRPLTPLDGGPKQTLASQRGKVVIVNFWANWCEPCRTETPLLERTQKRIAKQGGTILGVAFETTTPNARAFAREYGLTYPLVRDVGGKFAEEYGTRALPETFVLDRKGRVAAIFRGPIDEEFIRTKVDPLLREPA